MERIAYKKLLEWKKSSNRKPLIINGARQVGKSLKQYPELQAVRYSLLPYIKQDNFENVPLFAVR